MINVQMEQICSEPFHIVPKQSDTTYISNDAMRSSFSPPYVNILYKRIFKSFAKFVHSNLHLNHFLFSIEITLENILQINWSSINKIWKGTLTQCQPKLSNAISLIRSVLSKVSAYKLILNTLKCRKARLKWGDLFSQPQKRMPCVTSGVARQRIPEHRT